MNRGPFEAHDEFGPEGNEPTNGGIPDHLIDSICDGGMPRQKMRDALDAIASNSNQVDDYHWTADALDALRADTQTPDMSEIILARTGMQRSWLSTMMRRKMVIGRIAGVAAMLALIGGAFMIQRAAPEAFNTDPTPVKELANAFPTDAAHAASTIRTPAIYTVAQPAAFDEDLYMLDDHQDGAWRDSLLAVESFRGLWSNRSASPQPLPQLTPIGYPSDTITLIAPVLPEKERESSAAIIAGQR